MQSKPFVSVVMPSFNQCKFIEESILSVLNQSYAHLELIVADGGSKDGTLDLLTTLQKQDKRLRWFSAKDNGPAHALNKALNQVRGTIIGWLNSDDLYTEGAVKRAVNILTQPQKILMVYGHGHNIDGGGQFIKVYPTLTPERNILNFQHHCFICQPTVFFTRTLFKLLGPLDETLKTAFDFDYWLRSFITFQKRIAFIDTVQALSRLHDECITMSQRPEAALESMKLIHSYLSITPIPWFSYYIREFVKSESDKLSPHLIREQLSKTLFQSEFKFNEDEKRYLNEQILSKT